MTSFRTIPFRAGNLGVARLLALRRGEQAPHPRSELDQLAEWRALGFDAVEDYIGWAAVERQQGRPDWRAHREHAREAHRLGMAYVIYPWAHSLPAWHRAGAHFVPGRCLEHDRPGALPSLFAEETWTALEGFHRAVASALGDVVDGVVAAFPADYGEVGSPCGMAGWLLGDDPARDHQHEGLWCGEAPARAQFAAQMRARYGTPEVLGAAWALPPDDCWQHCPYPGLHATLAHRADFARFLRGAVTTLAARQAALVAELFPRVPREFKLGHCSEALELGTDWHALVEVAARAGMTVRFTGAGQGEIFSARLSGLCRSHGVRFATEAPREVGDRALSERLFTDLAAGTTEFFEFPEQLAAVRQRLTRLHAALGRPPLARPLACFYATTDLPLSPGHGAPEALARCWPALRRVADLAALDEGQIAHGALHGVAGLLLLDGAHLPRRTLVEVDAWVRAGGVLVSGAERAPQVLPEAPTATPDVASQRQGAHGPHETAPPDASEPWRDLLAALEPQPALRCVLNAPHAAHRLHPGDAFDRLFLGPGWLGREEGAWAFPDAGASVPCRWTGAAAEFLLASPDEPVDLLLDLFVPPRAPRAPLGVQLDGVRLGSVDARGRQVVRLPLDARHVAPRGALRRVLIEADTHRPHAHGDSDDRRDLGVLVRAAALLPRGARWADTRDSHALLEHQHGLRCGTLPLARRHGAGLVLSGDGTPLSALAWWISWLAGALGGAIGDALGGPLPDPPRDALQRCLVTALQGGLLLHNPDEVQPAAPRLVGSGSEHAPRELSLAPLETRWLPVSEIR